MLPAALGIAAIFGLSSIPNLAGPDLGLPGADKLYHLIEYGGVGLFVGRAYGRFERTAPRAGWWTVLSMGGIGLLDEFYQGFVPGRYRDATDFAADLTGAILGVLVFNWLARRFPLAR